MEDARAARRGLDLPFATIVPRDGTAVGSTRFLALRPEHRSPRDRLDVARAVRLGHGRERRGEAPAARRTRSRRWGCRRVEFKTDALNERSRGAIEALRRDVRGHPPQAHARPRRREPRLGLVQRPRRRLARGAQRASRRGLTRSGPPRRSAYTVALPGIREELEHTMIERIQRDRRAAASARRCARGSPSAGIALDARRPELVLLCVPDRAIAEVARELAPGPWVAHVSGATPLAALDPHVRRFGLHPLQTFTRRRGAGAARRRVGGRHRRDRRGARGRSLARRARSACGRSISTTSDRAAYHAGAAIASNYLVTLRRAAGSLLEAAGAPPEALDPADAAHDRERLRAHGPDRSAATGRRSSAISRRSAPSAPSSRTLYRVARRRRRVSRSREGAHGRSSGRCRRRARASAARRRDRPRADDGRAPRRPPLAPPRRPRRNATPS